MIEDKIRLANELSDIIAIYGYKATLEALKSLRHEFISGDDLSDYQIYKNEEIEALKRI